jgi:hypothetical protein
MNQDEIRWLAGQFRPVSPLSYNWANHFQLKVDYFVLFGTKLSFTYLIYFMVPETIFS